MRGKRDSAVHRRRIDLYTPTPVSRSAQRRAGVVAEEIPVQQRRQVSSTVAEPARP